MGWATPRTSQDIPYVSKDVIEREVKGDLDYLKSAVDDNVTDIATNATNIATNVTDITALETKEIWIPCTGWYDDSGGTYEPAQESGGKCYDADDYGHITFKIPYDFASITRAYVRCMSFETNGTANIDIFAKYGATTEDWDNHDESDTSSTYATTNTKIFEIDVSGILTNLSANDSGVFFIQTKDGVNFFLNGFYLKYSM